MAKFLNKKEQVIHFQLTPYGKYSLSKGTFRPVYYALHDDGIIYDSKYAGFTEEQNKIHKRIKEDTQYLEGIVAFADIETSVPPVQILGAHRSAARLDGALVFGGLFLSTGTRTDILGETVVGQRVTEERNETPAKDILKFNSVIGDARFDGQTQQAAPAWKIVTLQGEISSSAVEDYYTEEKIPQLNVDVNYIKRVRDPSINLNPTQVDEFINKTDVFADGKIIELIEDDLVVYADELNTELLTENFDIEVFRVEDTPGRANHATVTIGAKGGGGTPPSGGEYDSKFPEPGDTVTVYLGPRGPGGDEGLMFVFRTGSLIGADSPSSTGRTDWPIRVLLPTTASDDSEDVRNMYLGISANQLANNLANELNGWATIVRTQAGEEKPTFCADFAGADSPGPPYVINLYTVQKSRSVPKSYPVTTNASSRIGVTNFASGTATQQVLYRKFFEKKIDQIIDGFMVTEAPVENVITSMSTGSVEYYFDVLTDQKVDQKLACRGAENFNKNSYYIDIDFDCDGQDGEITFYDIYGSEVGDPEICQT